LLQGKVKLLITSLKSFDRGELHQQRVLRRPVEANFGFTQRHKVQ